MKSKKNPRQPQKKREKEKRLPSSSSWSFSGLPLVNHRSVGRVEKKKENKKRENRIASFSTSSSSHPAAHPRGASTRPPGSPKDRGPKRRRERERDDDEKKENEREDPQGDPVATRIRSTVHLTPPSTAVDFFLRRPFFVSSSCLSETKDERPTSVSLSLSLCVCVCVAARRDDGSTPPSSSVDHDPRSDETDWCRRSQSEAELNVAIRRGRECNLRNKQSLSIRKRNIK